MTSTLPSASVEAPRSIETSHEDMIHDAQLDYYGKRLATCSSDRTIKVFEVIDGNATGSPQTLTGHQGPVWQVAWAHPSFGPILASCSYDGKVIIWKDNSNGASNSNNSAGNAAGNNAYRNQAYGAASGNEWTKIKEHALHSASVNSIAWAPHELGSVLLCASSDGNVSVLTFNNDGTWAVDMVSAHPIGCNAVSWAPAVLPGSLVSAQQPQAPTAPGQVSQPSDSNNTPLIQRFATAGCDNLVKIWEYSSEHNRWIDVENLEGHSDWVRDVSFAPNIGLPRSYLASASQDRTVCIWTQDTPNSDWIKTYLNPTSTSSSSTTNTTNSTSSTTANGVGAGKFPDTVWRVSWSVSGNVLAVSCGDGKISLWKENLKGAWECVSEMDS